MTYESELRDAIARTLASGTTADALVEACVRFGLAGGDESETWLREVAYVQDRLAAKPLPDLLRLGEEALQAYEHERLHTFRLGESLRVARAGGKRRISEVTRTNLLDELLLLGALEGKLELDVFLRRIWPIDHMPSGDPRHKTFAGDLWRHMVMNDDWSPHDLLERLDVMGLSDETFSSLLELIVHPTVRREDEQAKWLEAINKHVQRDRFLLTEAESISGYPTYRLRPLDAGVAAAPKNLIFASYGLKPEIVLADAVHNDLRVVKNGESCLFYNQAIPERGLLWRDLVVWWAEMRSLDANAVETARGLYSRLAQSLASSPERSLFRCYFESFKGLGDRMPALIPQVYLHYDPRTVRELYGEKRLPRQRMDFLLLLNHGHRVVIEVDGAQHYSSNGRPDPQLYAEMVEADRQLRLCGYEVYRFGGHEFSGEGGGAAVIRAFFESLFKKHQVR